MSMEVDVRDVRIRYDLMPDEDRLVMIACCLKTIKGEEVIDMIRKMVADPKWNDQAPETQP